MSVKLSRTLLIRSPCCANVRQKKFNMKVAACEKHRYLFQCVKLRCFSLSHRNVISKFPGNCRRVSLTLLAHYTTRLGFSKQRIIIPMALLGKANKRSQETNGRGHQSISEMALAKVPGQVISLSAVHANFKRRI